MENDQGEIEEWTSKYNIKEKIYTTSYIDEFIVGTGFRSILYPEFVLYKGNQSDEVYLLNEECVAEIDFDKETLSYLIIEIMERKEDYKTKSTGKKYTSKRKLNDIRDMMIQLFDDKK